MLRPSSVPDGTGWVGGCMSSLPMRVDIGDGHCGSKFVTANSHLKLKSDLRVSDHPSAVAQCHP